MSYLNDYEIITAQIEVREPDGMPDVPQVHQDDSEFR